MKKIIYLITILLLFPLSIMSADLAWDYDDAHEITTYFLLYYSDTPYIHHNEEDYYTFPFYTEDTVVDDDTVYWKNFEEKLDLEFDIEYKLHLERVRVKDNKHQSSGFDGQDSVFYTRKSSENNDNEDEIDNGNNEENEQDSDIIDDRKSSDNFCFIRTLSK